MNSNLAETSLLVCMRDVHGSNTEMNISKILCSHQHDCIFAVKKLCSLRVRAEALRR